MESESAINIKPRKKSNKRGKKQNMITPSNVRIEPQTSKTQSSNIVVSFDLDVFLILHRDDRQR